MYICIYIYDMCICVCIYIYIGIYICIYTHIHIIHTCCIVSYDIVLCYTILRCSYSYQFNNRYRSTPCRHTETNIEATNVPTRSHT